MVNNDDRAWMRMASRKMNIIDNKICIMFTHHRQLHHSAIRSLSLQNTVRSLVLYETRVSMYGIVSTLVCA